MSRTGQGAKTWKVIGHESPDLKDSRRRSILVSSHTVRVFKVHQVHLTHSRRSEIQGQAPVQRSTTGPVALPMQSYVLHDHIPHILHEHPRHPVRHQARTPRPIIVIPPGEARGPRQGDVNVVEVQPLEEAVGFPREEDAVLGGGGDVDEADVGDGAHGGVCGARAGCDVDGLGSAPPGRVVVACAHMDAGERDVVYIACVEKTYRSWEG